MSLAAITLLTGCGSVTEPPTDPLQISAPPLVEVDPEVEALALTPIRALSPARARRIAQRARLGIGFPTCEGEPTGSGFALDGQTLIADREVVPGAGKPTISTKGRQLTVGASSAYGVGNLGVVRVEGRLPRPLTPGGSISLGSSVVVVGNRDGARLRALAGVLVDSVPGASFGVPSRVLRLSTTVRADGVGGLVLDTRGGLVGVVFATDPRTTLALAIPLPTLRTLLAARDLEALPAC